MLGLEVHPKTMTLLRGQAWGRRDWNTCAEHVKVGIELDLAPSGDGPKGLDVTLVLIR